MSYNKTNIFTGWGVWFVATLVYLSTIEPTTSFWDCGEFIASAYKLEVGHPPGAPFFMMVARLFAMFAPAGYEATAVNVMSALCSSFTILFLFWSITHFAKKIADKSEGEESSKTLAIMGAGAIGALAYTFSDSFWFSAVEGEVYAMSSLFTALVFWAILKWETMAEKGLELRWIILIAYLMGLSIGVHLLNLLAIPAIAYVYYFKRFKPDFKGIVFTGALSMVILLFVQYGIVQGFLKLAAKFELFFVNDLGMSFNSGVIAYALFVIGAITALIWFSHKRQWRVVNISTISLLMVLIGYSSFALIVIRSSANPPMDENNPENLFTLLSYLNREQYGDRPLGTGQYWNTPTDIDKQYKDGNPTWVKSFSVKEKRGTRERRLKSFRWEYDAQKYTEQNEGNFYIVEEYIDSGEKKGAIPNYDERFTTVFPRMYSTQANHIREYKAWSNYKNWNVERVFESPLVDGMLMNNEEFAFHIDQQILNAGMDKRTLERTLNRLFGAYKMKASDVIKVREANEILIFNEQSKQFDQLAQLNDERMRLAVSQYFVDILAERVNTGRTYVQRMEQLQRRLDQEMRLATMRANATGSNDDYQRAIQIRNEMDRLYEDLMPSFGENWRFFVEYQVNWMYWRYFMWNFAGKQNDQQGHGNYQDGNWISGLDFIDEDRVGNRAELPYNTVNNKGFNKFYLLPFLLGLIGLVFQLLRAPKDFWVTFLLFVLTGFAIVVYLNQYPYQPRERDYAYVGSFYAFSIWIGLGMYALYWATRKLKWKELGLIGAFSVGAGLLFYTVENFAGSSNHSFSLSVLFMAGIATVLFALAMLLQSAPLSNKIRAVVPILLCLIVPILMAADGWDDHSRAKRETGVDFAKNYLDSLEPNAILFTNGDNDTFPLWYVQEVEGYRTDVRIVNLSLLNTDWYIDQMKRRAYDSPPVQFKLEEEKYRQGTRDIVLLEEPENKANPFINLQDAMDVALDDDERVDYGDGKGYHFLPTHSFTIPVDSADVVNKGVVSVEEAANIVDEISWTITDGNDRPKPYLLKNHFMVLELLRNNDWTRPIYFAVTTGPDSYIGLQDYFRLEGLAYRFVPIKYPKNPNPNVLGGFAADKMYENVMEKFQWGNMEDTTGSGIYMDENNRRMTTNLRLQFTNLAEELIAQGKDSKGLDILRQTLTVTPEKNVPFDRVMLPVAESLMALTQEDSTRAATMPLSPGEEQEALKLGTELSERLFTLFEDEIEYYLSLDGKFFEDATEDLSLMYSVNNRILQVVRTYQPDNPLVEELEERMDMIDKAIERKENELRDLGSVSF